MLHFTTRSLQINDDEFLQTVRGVTFRRFQQPSLALTDKVVIHTLGFTFKFVCQLQICLVHASPERHILPVTAGLLVALTCQRSDLDLVSIGDSIEGEKDRLLETVCITSRRD